MQNIEENRHPFLHRIVEAFVQAIINPFKSRASTWLRKCDLYETCLMLTLVERVSLTVELQALKGLHLLILKYPQVMLASESVVGVWLKPICSRLASSHEPTWEQSRLILKEASRSVEKWSSEVLEMLQDCMIQYALPAMKAHMEKERNKDALQLWILTLLMMKANLATDLTILNDTLYIPENSMRHQDASVRLMSMEAWKHLVAVFRQSKGWFFKKSVVQLLVRPIIVCIEDESLLNVVQTAFTTWQNIVSALVQDFGRFCMEQPRSPEEMQANARKWKRWFDESMAKPLVAIIERRHLSKKDEVSSREVLQFINFAAIVWKSDATAHPNSSSGSPTSSAEEAAVSFPDKSRIKSAVFGLADTQDGHASPFSMFEERRMPSIGSNLFGLAFILPDVLHMIRNLIARAEKLTCESDRNHVAALAQTVWSGLCRRLHPSRLEKGGGEQNLQKLRLRLLRLCLQFAFGMSSSVALLPDSQTPNSQAEAHAAMPAKDQVESSCSSCLFGIRWQLQLLDPLVSGFQAQEELTSLLLHPKSKLYLHLLDRIHVVKNQSPSCTRILDRWGSGVIADRRIDFSSRTNTLCCAVVYLLLEYSASLDSNLEDQGKLASFDSMGGIVAQVLKCADTNVQDVPTLLSELIQFAETVFQAGKAMLEETVLAGKPCTSEDFLSFCLESYCVSAKKRAQPCTNVSASSGIDQPDTPTRYRAASTSASTAAGTTLSSSCMRESIEPKRVMPELSDGREGEEEDDSRQRLSPHRDPPTTPKKDRKLVAFGTPQRSLPPSPSVIGHSSAQRKPQSKPGSDTPCICPDLVDSTEPISQLYRHFPLAFRPFFSFYKIKTIGDLSVMTLDQVKAFGIKDPVITVSKALEEFRGRKDRLRSIASSPFRQRMQSSPAGTPGSPAPIAGASPSPRRILKRPMPPTSRFLPLESPQRKRARRSLLELSSELDAAEEEEREATGTRLPKLAERVTFCLPTGDGEGATRIARPGEDSQDSNAGAQQKVREDAEERLEQYSLKFLQHLRRSAYYMDKIVSEDESLQSEAGLPTNADKMNTLSLDFQQAHDLIAKVSSRLQIVAEANATKDQKVLNRDDGGKQ